MILKLSKGIVALLIVQLATACSVAVSPHSLEQERNSLIPKSWSVDTVLVMEKESQPNSFWKSWNDPVLMELIGKTEKSNTDIEIARANVLEAYAVIDTATSSLFPSIATTFKANANKVGGIAAHNYDVGLLGSWTLNFFGREFASLRSAKEYLASENMTLANVTEIAKSEVAISYINLKFAQKKLEILELSIDNLKDSLNLALFKEKAGLATSLDSLSANSELKMELAQVPVLLQAIAQYKNAISRLTSTKLGEIQFSSSEIPSPPEKVIALVPAQALRNRPDVIASEHLLIKAYEDLNVARAEYYPTINLSGNLASSSSQISALGSSGTGIAGLVANVSLPIINWGAISAKVEIQKANIEKAHANYKAIILKALEEVDNALIAIKASEKKHEELTAAFSFAKESFDLAKIQYEKGISDYTDLLVAQRRYLSASEAYYSNLGDRASAVVTLFKALGGDWTKSTGEENDSK